MRCDAVVLAGGRATRLGGTPKPGIVVGSASLLDHALAATAEAEVTAVVGPQDAVGQAGRSLVVTREDPPFGGPVAGLDAGLRALDRPGAPPWVLLLAVDVPGAGAAVPALRSAVAGAPDADGAHLVRADRAQWLVGLYRRTALTGALRAIDPHGAPVRRLVARLRLVTVPDEAGTSDDVDTWEDVERLTVRYSVGDAEEGER
ncbi:NTP transferase domain-containing protein [Isoptericola sp. S6320L]|uniref:molybdenum cofactor guanylyltransferase n=1 Tax=Isoptericola sp. S6320L TaxID=2926411 RepID=UPI001FF54052|nr:NTP transferase domain-containing protein [Isoptericola sp. S6320L]MCK0116209.1 NTP transferase domain-containing protein [Isoptericola sp. S6320L]